MPCPAASSLPIPSSSLVWMRTATWCWATRCSPRTPPASGRWRAMSRPQPALLRQAVRPRLAEGQPRQQLNPICRPPKNIRPLNSALSSGSIFGIVLFFVFFVQQVLHLGLLLPSGQPVQSSCAMPTSSSVYCSTCCSVPVPKALFRVVVRRPCNAQLIRLCAALLHGIGHAAAVLRKGLRCHSRQTAPQSGSDSRFRHSHPAAFFASLLYR